MAGTTTYRIIVSKSYGPEKSEKVAPHFFPPVGTAPPGATQLQPAVAGSAYIVLGDLHLDADEIVPNAPSSASHFAPLAVNPTGQSPIMHSITRPVATVVLSEHIGVPMSGVAAA